MEYNLNYELIGKRARDYRLKLKLTQAEVSEKAGISLKHVSKIETGKSPPSLACFVSISNALNTTTDHLLMDTVAASTPIFLDEAKKILEACTPEETYIAIELLKSFKQSIEAKHLRIMEHK